ncbi:hypothetical protein L7F22_014244 [Adiantum nelumboides]|nr:hypothetical protein [Adiantum nelumboides]
MFQDIFLSMPLDHYEQAPTYDIEADVSLSSHMHGTSRMPYEYMRLLRKSDPKSYHKLKKQYEMDFDKAHEEYNDDNDMDDNDMDEFINDWYVGDDIAGCSTKGYKACPICGDWLKSTYSKHLNKNIYLQHRRFLPEDHSLRQRTQARHFNGKVESGQCPIAMTPMDWYNKWTEGPLIDPESKLASDEEDDRGQGRSTLTPSISIWFQLEYWKDLKICHLLDPMHIFKNVGHSLWKHHTGLKDTEQARNDLKERNCKSDLWPRVDEESGRKEYAHAPWVLTPIEIATINRRIRSIQTPTRYGASLQNIFTMDDSSLSNLKTHDWHNFLKAVAQHSEVCDLKPCRDEKDRELMQMLDEVLKAFRPSLCHDVIPREVINAMEPTEVSGAMESFGLLILPEDLVSRGEGVYTLSSFSMMENLELLPYEPGGILNYLQVYGPELPFDRDGSTYFIPKGSYDFDDLHSDIYQPYDPRGCFGISM